MSSAAGPVALLFTDLANSTELLQQLGDERVQRLLRAHHKLLTHAVGAHGAQEVRWLGDGLMTVFVSTADAVRCAIALQQAARRRAVGERLSVRVGLHVADALREETDYFGVPVAIVRRLCARAQGGQILCSGLVAGLLAGQQAFTFRDCGLLELTGLAAPVAASEVLYRHYEPAALLAHPPFVGRAAELTKLTHHLQEACAGRGGLVLLAGEPGIGKTRLTEEFTESASELGALVLAGRCYEGEWAPPYGPFAEAIAAYTRAAEPEQLRQDLGLGAPPIARLVAAIRERLPDIPEAAPLQPNEERVRLLDAVSQFLIATSARTPVVLIVDDLHWADKGSIAMLRHVARFAPRNRLLILGAYRDSEVDRSHPLTEALGTLPRETRCEHLQLKGLERDAVEQLLETIADQEVPDALVATISAETNGNPFFIREALLHLVEEGKIFRRDGRWVSELTIEQMGIPEGVKQVITRRIGRLSVSAQSLLIVGAAFSGGFHLAIAGRVAGLDEATTLDAVDEALAAQVLQRGNHPESCDFVHALIRHTLYGALSPPRQVRLHRQIAETIEEVYGVYAAEHAAEIAEQYHRSAALPGAERGVAHCLRAAEQAERAAAFSEAAMYLRMAVELLPSNDPQRARLLARLGLALAWSLTFEDAVKVAGEAGELLAATEGNEAAADYLATAARATAWAGCMSGAGELAERGMGYVGRRRDATWALLRAMHLARQEATDPANPGIRLDTPERRELVVVVRALPPEEGGRIMSNEFLDAAAFDSRQDVLQTAGNQPGHLMNLAGEFRRALPLWQFEAQNNERQGCIAAAAGQWALAAICHFALGNLPMGRVVYHRGMELAARLANATMWAQNLTAAQFVECLAVEQGWESLLERDAFLQESPVDLYRVLAVFRSAAMRLCVRLGRSDEALRFLETLLAAVEHAPGCAGGYVGITCGAAETLWRLERTDHIEVIEHNLRDKIIDPDFRTPMHDGRLAVAQLCALRGHHDEATEWFARARAVLDEQGARPLRAIVDCDEALMYVRRGAAGDGKRAAPLLDAALDQFRAIGMTGWIKRAEELRVAGVRCRVPGIREDNLEPDARNLTPDLQNLTPAPPRLTPEFVFRKEGDYWTIAFEGCAFRLKDAKGLRYLVYLLRHPGREFHALDLMRLVSGVGGQVSGADSRRPGTRDQAASLDAQAKSEYKRRLGDLRIELAEAEHNSDLGRAAKASEEMESIAGQVAAAVGLGGRDRPVGADAERARLTVTKGIKAALGKIRANHPGLARHFAASIKTGYFCSYTPDPQRSGLWVL